MNSSDSRDLLGVGKERGRGVLITARTHARFFFAFRARALPSAAPASASSTTTGRTVCTDLVTDLAVAVRWHGDQRPRLQRPGSARGSPDTDTNFLHLSTSTAYS